MTAIARRHLRVVSDDPDLEELAASRPRTRADCEGVPRPCPYVSCRHNLFLDVKEESSGRIVFTAGTMDPLEVDAERSCALDVADAGGTTLDGVAATMRVTRERVRQIEAKALRRVKGRSNLKEYAAEGKTFERRSFEPEDGALAKGLGKGSGEPIGRDCVSFFSADDEAVCHSVWTMFVKDSNGRGFDARSQRSLIAAKALAKARAEGRDYSGYGGRAMGRGAVKAKIKASWETLSGKLGREPTSREVCEDIGESTPASVGVCLGKLAKVGAIRRVGRSSGPVPKADVVKAPPHRTRAPASARRRKPTAALALVPLTAPLGLSSDPAIAALQAELDRCEKRAGALRDAITILQSPLYGGASA